MERVKLLKATELGVSSARKVNTSRRRPSRQPATSTYAWSGFHIKIWCQAGPPDEGQSGSQGTPATQPLASSVSALCSESVSTDMMNRWVTSLQVALYEANEEKVAVGTPVAEAAPHLSSSEFRAIATYFF